MSVLIKGMEMPSNCDECKLRNGMGKDDGKAIYHCAPLAKWVVSYPLEKADLTTDCPLVPVPPHGRLIDIEPFMRGLYEEIQVGEITYTSQEIYDMMDNEIKSMPTIIEAEEGE